MKLGLGNAWLKLGAAVTTYLVTTNAFANDLSSLASQTNLESTSFSQIISYGSYAAGSVVGVRGVMLCKAHGADPGNAPLNKGISHLAASAGLIAAPFVISNVLGSMGATEGSGSGVQAFRNGTF